MFSEPRKRFLLFCFHVDLCGISRDTIDSESGESTGKRKPRELPRPFGFVSGFSPDLREIHFPIGIPVKASPRIIISRHGRRVLEGKCGVWGGYAKKD
jgi:hypothetical protein